MMVEGEEFVEGEFFREREFVLIGLLLKKGSVSVSSELLNMLLHVRHGSWSKGNLSGGWSLSEENVRGSLFVSSE